MGAGYCPTSREITYHSVDYKNSLAIQGLLRYRSDFVNLAGQEMNTELLGICLDIKDAYEHISMTSRQALATKLYSEGWTESDIGVKMGGITHQAVHKLICKVCDKMSNYLEKDYVEVGRYDT